MSSAILDRVLQHCTVINIKGESYRLKEHKEFMRQKQQIVNLEEEVCALDIYREIAGFVDDEHPVLGQNKRAYEKQIQMPGFPIKKTLDDFDFSFQPLTEVIGVVLVYAIKFVVENLSKNNSWPDKHGSAPSDGIG